MLFSTDKLGIVRRIRFASLDAKRQAVMAAHDSRAPKDDELLEFVASYRTLLETTPPPATRIRFGLVELYEALGDPIAALTVAAEIAEIASPSNIRRAASSAARIVTRLGRKEHTRRYTANRQSKMAVLGLCDRIVAKAPESFERRRLELFLAISRKRFEAALEHAGVLARMKRAGVGDLVRLIEQLVDRPDPSRFLPAIARELAASRSLIEEAGKQNFILGLRARLRDDPEALAALDLEPLDAEAAATAFAGLDRAAIETFVGRREILIGSETSEGIKLAALAEFRRKLVPSRSEPAQSQYKYLILMSNTVRFWDDPEFRAEVLADVESMVGRRGDQFAEMSLGVVALLREDFAKAEQHFDAVVACGGSFVKSGASSFVADMDAYAVSDALCSVDVDFGSTVRTDRAFVACADVRYFRRYAAGYLSSLRETGAKTRVHLHIAGDPDEARAAIGELGRRIGDVSFSIERPPIALPAYYASMRFLRAPALIEHVADRVVLTDIDVGFRSNPDGFVADPAFAAADIGLRMYDRVRVVREAGKSRRTTCRFPRTYGWNQINAACVVLAATLAGREAAATVSRDMARHLQRVVDRGINAWWVDQNALFYSYRGLAAAGNTRFANIEDVGMPYGSFDYEGSYTIGRPSPLFIHAA